MPDRITDPKLIQELEDRKKAQRAGVDYDTIAKSRDAQINKRDSGSIFGAGSRRDVKGSRSESFFKGIIGDPIEGITQGLMRGGNAAQRALGIDPNTSLENTVRGWVGAKPATDPVRAQGVFSDQNVAFNEARRKAQEAESEEQRVAKGRGGFDVSRLAGSVFQPGPKGSGIRGAIGAGAVGAGLQPVDLEPGENYAVAKAKQAGIGAGAGGLTGAIGTRVGRRMARAGSNPSEARRAAEAAEELGVDVGTAQVTSHPALSRTASLSANLPFGRALTRGAERTEAQMGEALEDVAGQIGGGRTKYQVGQAATNAIRREGGFVDRFRQQSDTLYNAVNQHAPADLDATDTMMAMTRIANSFRNNPELGQRLANTRLMGMAQDIAQNPNNPGRLAFNEAQALRSEVGRMMGEGGLVNDIPRAELANVYRALTGDMRSALQQTGNSRAVRTFDRAANYYRAGQGRIDKLEQILGNSSSAEQIADRIAGMGRKDSSGLYQLRRSMNADEWDNIASGTFRQMGEPTPGAADELGQGFSPSRFLTNFNKVQQNPRAFNAMFGGTRYAGVQPQLRALATLSDRLKDNAKLANHSGSGYTNALAGLVGVGTLGPIPAMKLMGVNFAFSNAMASPAFLRAQISAARAMERASRGSGRALEAVSQRELAKLAGIAAQFRTDEEEQPGV